MTRLRQDLIHAVRMFGRARGFTAVAVLVLAIGIGANTAMFSFVNELLLRPLWGDGGEFVGVHSRERSAPDSWKLFSYPNYADLRDRGGVFDALLAQTYTMAGAPAGDGTRRLLAAVVSSNYFDTLGIRLAAGRAFTFDEERPGARVAVAIVPYAAWEQAGFDPGMIGRTLTLNSTEHTIVGVAPKGFSGTMALLSPEVYVPLGMFDALVDDRFKNNGRGLADRSNAGLSVSGRLAPGVTMEAANARLDVLARQLESGFPADNRDLALSVSPLSRLSMSPAPQTNTVLATFTAFLMTLSGLVLVIACLNMANMLMARGAARRREIAVRLAIGARRGRVIRQLLTESLVLAVSGAGLGLLFSFWAMRAFTTSLNAALPFKMTLGATPDPAVLAATIIFTAIGTIAFGLGPALRLSRRDLVADLKDRGSDGLARRRLSARNVLVVGQVALSMALLTAGGIFARTTLTAAAGRPGYAYDGLMIARVDAKLAGQPPERGAVAYGDLLARLRSMPGVTAATLTSNVPFSDSLEGGMVERVTDRASEPVRTRAYRIVGADYFRTLGLRMVRGREFTPAEEASPAAPGVAIIDEALARRLFGDRDPVGQLIRMARDSGDGPATAAEPMEIVGIAPPIRAEILHSEPAPHVYVPFGRHYRSGMFVHVKSAPGVDDRVTIDAVRREVRDRGGLPLLSLSTMQAFHDSNPELWALRAGASVFAGLGLLAMLLASIGLYGVRAYMVAQRTREIGIRMALGAAPRQVVREVLTDGAWLAAAGLAIGLPFALLISVMLRSVFVEVGGIDLIVLAGSTASLAVAAMFASALPARRAAAIEPLTALRTE